MKSRPCLRCEDTKRCAEESLWKDCEPFLDYMRYVKEILKRKMLFCVTCGKTIEEDDLHVHDGLDHKVVWRIDK